MERRVVDAEEEGPTLHDKLEPAQTTTPDRARKDTFGVIREIAETLIIALVIVFITNTFLLQSTIVLGQSMDPTLADHERILIDKISYRLHSPERGDIIVFNPPNSSTVPYIKRVIGLAGERVAIHQGHVYVNGEELEEPYLQGQDSSGMFVSADMPERTIEPGEVFVLGDNRGASNDSRYFGDVPDSSIIGKALFAYWPLDRFGPIH